MAACSRSAHTSPSLLLLFLLRVRVCAVAAAATGQRVSPSVAEGRGGDRRETRRRRGETDRRTDTTRHDRQRHRRERRGAGAGTRDRQEESRPHHPRVLHSTPRAHVRFPSVSVVRLLASLARCACPPTTGAKRRPVVKPHRPPPSGLHPRTRGSARHRSRESRVTRTNHLVSWSSRAPTTPTRPTDKCGGTPISRRATTHFGRASD